MVVLLVGMVVLGRSLSRPATERPSEQRDGFRAPGQAGSLGDMSGPVGPVAGPGGPSCPHVQEEVGSAVRLECELRNAGVSFRGDINRRPVRQSPLGGLHRGGRLGGFPRPRLQHHCAHAFIWGTGDQTFGRRCLSLASAAAVEFAARCWDVPRHTPSSARSVRKIPRAVEVARLAGAARCGPMPRLEPRLRARGA